MQETTQKGLPKREEIDSKHKWKLEDLFASDAVWEDELKQLMEKLPTFTAYKGTLSDSAQQLLGALDLRGELSLMLERLFVYARMRRDENNANSTYQALTDRISSFSVQVRSAFSFVVPEILAMPEEMLQRFRTQEPGLATYDFYFQELLRQKAHVLSTTEEELLAQVGEISGAPQNIFRMLNHADLKFPNIKNANGEEVELTHGRYIQFMESPDRDVRQTAYEALYDTYRKNQNTFSATLSGSVKEDVFYARVRKYNSALEASLDRDHVPVSVYDQLIKTVRDYLPSFYRYMELRKKLLNLDELQMYDIYTPLVPDVEMKLNYEEAYETMIKGLAPLGTEYEDLLRQARDQGWIDVHENEGKTSGAYSFGAYGTHPYVLLNYQDNVDNMFTIAHEMGHAIHSYYSDQEQPYHNAQYTIFVAEVASTVNESLLMDWMLKNTTDKRERLYLLNHYLEQFRGTVFRQTMFAEFEKLIHERVEQGGALTPETLSEMYGDLNKDYYGSEVKTDDNIALEWARIPHYYNAFYVYKYATGFSAATALSEQILKEGEPAVARYVNFLKSGGSDYPLELLKGAGVDMTTSAPIDSALQVFTRLLDEFEKLIEA